MQKMHVLAVAAAVALMVPALAWSGKGGNPEEWKAMRAATFAEADSNGDGALAPAEFATFKELVHRKRAERRFQRADADGNGVVTLAELEAMPRHGSRDGGCR
jgi:hypothetical protein